MSPYTKRPPYRVFYEPEPTAQSPAGLYWHHVNPDGTPGPLASMSEQQAIATFFKSAIYAGETWPVEFFAALKANGKANLRGQE